MKKLFVVTLALALPLAVAAQTIWRCGPDGRSYSSTPCNDGRSIETLQPRPVNDLAEAQNRAARERRDADAMTHERLALESRQRGNGLAAIKSPEAVAQAPRPQAKKQRPKRAEEAGTWRATAPSSRHTKG
jgi:hypothetical protein